MDRLHPPLSHGVFKPVGHVVVALPTLQDRRAAELALNKLHLDASAITVYTAQDMLAQAAADIERADSMASMGQELNLVKEHQRLAQGGHHFLVVEVSDNDQAHQVAAACMPHRASRAQHYGRFIIEELIVHGDGEPQVAESPDRGLDPQVTSAAPGPR